MHTSMEHGPNSSLSAEVFLLDQKQLEHYWFKIDEQLDAQPELWNKWMTKEGIRSRLEDETLQMWFLCEKDGPIHAMFMTQILVMETGKLLQVFWIRGELLDGALKCISLVLDRFGSHHGCVRLAVIGRKGWERRLRGLGARFECITLERPINSVTRN